MSYSTSQKTTILVAIITTLGVIIGALVNNWKKRDELPNNIIDSLGKNGTEIINLKETRIKIAVKTSEALLQKRYDEVNDDFEDALKLTITPVIIKNYMDTVSITLGNYLSQSVEYYPQTYNGLDGVVIINRYTNRDLAVTSIFTKNNKLFGFYILPTDHLNK